MTGRHHHLIVPGIPASLDSVPFHRSADCVQRIAWQGFPVHLCMHRITEHEQMPAQYVTAHCHGDPEINLLIAAEGELIYRIELGDEIYTVSAPHAIWIPPGLMHSANVISGSGYFVCSVLNEKYAAMGIPLAPLEDGLPLAG